jgi:ketosteroid isomerase-like protein
MRREGGRESPMTAETDRVAEPPNARELGIRSRAAVESGDREGWLALFAEDAFVEDPIGPSPFDPEGKGHHGREGIAAFYDNVIAPSEAITFQILHSYLCGDEVADVGIITTTIAGGTHQAVVHGVYTYRTNGAGKLAALRAFWEFDALEMREIGN